MYQLRVISDHAADLPFWRNFIYDGSTGNFSINESLIPFNGRNIPNSKYIEFDTEEDALAFVLRWS